MKSTNVKTLALGGLALAVIAFLALNIFAGGTLRDAQADLTQSGLYSLSPGTREVIGSLKEPITLRLFVSRTLVDTSPGLGNYVNRVRELLGRYVALSDGKIRLEIIDPQPFSPEEDRAVGFKLQGIPVTEAGELGYFGLAATNTTDDLDVIGFFNPQRERFLEYDLTRLVYNLANPKKKVIGLVSGIPIDADPVNKYQPWRVVEMMKQFFEVRSLGLDPEIKDDVDVLLVVHPFGLSDKTLYAIDQYVMKGGKAMIVVDPYAEEGSRSNAAMRLPPDMGSDIAKLFKGWGIEYTRDKIVGDRRYAQRVSAGVDPSGRPIITNYLAWLTLPRQQLNANDVITGDLRVINVASAGFFDKAEGSPVTLEPLIVSSPETMPVDSTKVRRNPDPSAILKDFKSENKSLVIAARAGGKLKSAFPDGPPKEKDKDDAAKKEGDAAKPAEGAPATPPAAAGAAPPAHLAEAKNGVNLILVGDTDILADTFWLQVQELFGQQLVVPTANNADFIINALDNLAGSGAMVGLRGRGLSARPFTVVQDIERSAEAQYRDKEQALAKQLADVQSKLKDLQTKEQAGGSAVLTSEQREAIDTFRADMVKIRRDLREVQHDLRKDIQKVETWVKVVNIGAMPLIVALAAIALFFVRRGRARRRYAGALT
jgi:ABC-type uncharacterized transport system involved in gliding motility auxiliary subunit